MASNAIEIDALTKIFSKQKITAIDSLTALFPPGKVIGLIGPDGAGKTTLMRLIVGLLLPTKGRVKIFGCDTVKDAKVIHEMISYMPQRFGLYEDLSVLENLSLYADLQSLSKSEKEKKCEELLEFTNLKNFTKRLARNLSGGMKQKLGIACALLRTPKLLLLDEPSIGVDPIARRELWNITARLIEEKITIIWSTSYLEEAEKCDEVLLLDKGKVLYQGKPNHFIQKMDERVFLVERVKENPRVAISELLKNPDVLDASVQGKSIRLLLHAQHKDFDFSHLGIGGNAIGKKIQPRFEDAFIDVLGGLPKTIFSFEKMQPHIPKNIDVLIEAKNLTKNFGTFTAVKGISFAVKKGEIFGLLGPNGAGKSTTFKMLCGLLNPSLGSSYVAGMSLQSAPSTARSYIGYMAQKFSLYDNMTVLQNLQFFSGIYSNSKKDYSQVISNMIKIFFLEKYINILAKDIPLGFKQRLALACAIMHEPSILFLDEPTSGVDPLTRREFWNHINQLVSLGITVMITTHIMEEAEYCDRIGFINEGRIITMDTPEKLKQEAHVTNLDDAFIYFSKKQNVQS